MKAKLSDEDYETLMELSKELQEQEKETNNGFHI